MSIEQRMERMERQTKQLRLTVLVLAVALCAVVTIVATGEKRGDFDIVTARYINLKNETLSV